MKRIFSERNELIAAELNRLQEKMQNFFEGEIPEREKSRFLYSVYDCFCGDLAVYLQLFLFQWKIPDLES